MALTVLSISSQVAYGNVGNSVAVPAMQAAGLSVIAVPTLVSSNHRGLGNPAGFPIPARDLNAMLDALDVNGAFAGCAAVMTGYFLESDQVTIVARAIRRMKEKNPSLYVVVDPVLGDDETRLYVPQPVAEAVRDELMPLATCVKPNRFELEWLTGSPVTGTTDAPAAARKLGVAEVLVSSLPAGPLTLATAFVSAFSFFEIASRKKTGIPKGTGDLLTALWIAARLLKLEPEAALEDAMARLNRVIAASRHNSVLKLQALLGSSAA